MKGGWNFYRGSGDGAERYFREGHQSAEAAETYYTDHGEALAEVTTWQNGIQTEGPVGLAPGEVKAWVEGMNPVTGEVKGTIRDGGPERQPLRFVEFGVNNPKSLSLLESQDEGFHEVMEAVRDRQREAMVAYLSRIAVTRVGGRGAQRHVGGLVLEAAHVRHATSREGDPHFHQHVMINTRVLDPEGTWRGLDSVALRQHIKATNAVGERVLQSDLELHRYLADKGYSLGRDGEVEQLRPVVARFSKRTSQITENRALLEAEWRAGNPGEEPSPRQRNSWKAEAWNLGRKGKGSNRETVDEMCERVSGELAELGYDLRPSRRRRKPVTLQKRPVLGVDAADVAAEAVASLCARHSAWTEADVAEAVEDAVGRSGAVGEQEEIEQFVGDVASRVRAECVSLLDPELLKPTVMSRHLTHPRVVAEDQQLHLGLAGLAADGMADDEGAAVAAARGLDTAQGAAVAAIGSTRRLEVVIGPAGAGKTAVLSVAKERLDAQQRSLMLVSPTLRGAAVAADEVGGQASSLSKLLHANGWRWDQADRWVRLRPGETDPATGKAFDGPWPEYALGATSVVVIDEAGMVSVSQANALVDLVAESGASVRLVGDPAQLGQVGRGGVMGMAGGWVDPVVLESVHRFKRTVTNEAGVLEVVTDTEYGELSIAMRERADVAGVGGRLIERGQVVTHPDLEEALVAISETVAPAFAAGTDAVAVTVATNELAQALSEEIRQRRIEAGEVSTDQVATIRGGGEVGVGDRVITRLNDRAQGVLNRDRWTILEIHRDGSVTAQRGDVGRAVRFSEQYVSEQMELGYATTDYGVQGITTETAHVLVTPQTSAGGLYVGATRGRSGNTIHVVAPDMADASGQLLAALGRDRTDRGLQAAADQARSEADQVPPVAEVDLSGWRSEAELAALEERIEHELARELQRLAPRSQMAARGAGSDDTAAEVRRHADDARRSLAAAEEAAAGRRPLVNEVYADLQAARSAAVTIGQGPGRLGRRTEAVEAARALRNAVADRWPTLSLPGSGWDDELLQIEAQRVAESVLEPPLVELRKAAAEAEERAERLHTESEDLEVFEQSLARRRGVADERAEQARRDVAQLREDRAVRVASLPVEVVLEADRARDEALARSAERRAGRLVSPHQPAERPWRPVGELPDSSPEV